MIVSEKELKYLVKLDDTLCTVIDHNTAFESKIKQKVDCKGMFIAGGAIASKVLGYQNKADIDVFLSTDSLWTSNVSKKSYNIDDVIMSIGDMYFDGGCQLSKSAKEFYSNRFMVVEGNLKDVRNKVQLIVPVGEFQGFDLALSEIYVDNQFDISGDGLNLFSVLPVAKTLAPKTQSRIVKYIDRSAPTWDLLPRWLMEQFHKRTIMKPIEGEEFNNFQNEAWFKLFGMALAHMHTIPITERARDRLFSDTTPSDIIKAREAYREWDPKVNWEPISPYFVSKLERYGGSITDAMRGVEIGRDEIPF